MTDPNRKNRVHVVTVRHKHDKYTVELYDPVEKYSFEVNWNYWISLTQKERWNYK